MYENSLISMGAIQSASKWTTVNRSTDSESNVAIQFEMKARNTEKLTSQHDDM